MFINTNTILIIATLFLLLAVAFADVLYKYLRSKSAFNRARPILKDSVLYQRLFYKFYNQEKKLPVLSHGTTPYLPFDLVKYRQDMDEEERDGLMMMKIEDRKPVLYVHDFYGDDKIELADLKSLRFIKSSVEHN